MNILRKALAETRPEPTFLPCIENARTGRLNKPVAKKPMSYEDARSFLERHYAIKWARCEACVQPAHLVAH